MSYVELKCKTNFSFLRGASHPEELVERAATLGYPALAITDWDGVYGMPKAYWKAKDIAGFKLIVGAEIKIAELPRLTLLARDRKAYGLLCRLITESYRGRKKGDPLLSQAKLVEMLSEGAASGLVCLPDPGANYALLKDLFNDRLYLPLVRYLDGKDLERTREALAHAKNFDMPLVASNDVYYHTKERHALNDVLTCIREGVTLPEAGFKLFSNRERYLKSPQEMQRLFSDIPEAILNTLRIAESCIFSPRELRYRYPSEWIPSGQSAQSYLTELTWQGAKERYPLGVPSHVISTIERELCLIAKKEYADYFLTIHDIVSYARSRDILCQGRGSAANSIVCYCLGITAVSPEMMDMLFERFISEERDEPPDIDVDFEHERREEVIQYIYEKYGRDRAAMVSAVITYRRRSMIREIAKSFAVNVGTKKAKIVERDFEELAATSPVPEARDQMEILMEQMKGFPRHLSIHSGGFTLSADPITEIVPVEPASMEGRTIIQWDKYDLDYLGLLKVDILSLGMLTALRKTLALVGMDLHAIPPDDKATYQMIQRCDTVGTFQIESRAQMNMLGRLQPKEFYDLVIEVAIVRPGPIVGKMVHPYLRRRRGQEKIHFEHPKLRKILAKTLGVPLFQEQVMHMAIELANFTPGEADTLRRAIGAWRASGSISKIGQRLMDGLIKSGMSKTFAEQIFDQIKGFAQYGFPESHAVSFALLAYASCYLKCRYPAQFLCGMLNSQPMGFYANHTLVDDAKRHGVKVLPIHLNFSRWDCTMEAGAVRMGFRVVSGLSQSEVEALIQERETRYFQSLSDFLSRVHLRRDVLLNLAMGNAFAIFGLKQREALWELLDYSLAREAVQLPLFQKQSLTERDNFASLNQWEAITEDYRSYGLSVLGHPMTALRKLVRLPITTSREVREAPFGALVTVAGLIIIKQRPPTAKGMTFATLEDENGFVDLMIRPEVYEEGRELWEYQPILIVTGKLQRDGNTRSVTVVKARSYKSPDAEKAKFKSVQYYY